MIGEKGVTTGSFPGVPQWVMVAAGSFVFALSLGYFLFGSAAPAALDASEPESSEQLLARSTFVDGVMRQPFTVGRMLTALGVETSAHARIMADPNLAGDPTIPAGALYRIEYGEGSDRPVRGMTLEVDDSTLYQLQILPYTRLTAIRREITERQVHYAGLITTNFWLAILENDSLHHSLIPVVEEAMKWTVDLFHLSSGDRFKLIYRELLRDGRVMGVSRIEAISIQTADRTYTVYGQPAEDSVIFLDYYGAALRQRFLRAPVKFGIVSSPFSRARVHPVTGELKRHGGTDFAAPRGSPVYALADGSVKRRGQDNFNGKYIAITHDPVQETMYLHLDDFVPEIIVGKAVRQGQVIGYVGTTGQSTGPHVCLRFRLRGVEEDFLQYRDERVVEGGAVNTASFTRLRDSLQAVLEQIPYEEVVF